MANIGIRLETIYSLVQKGDNVADIGADHGLLGKKLLDNNRVNFIQLVENKKGPFQALYNGLSLYKDDNRLELSLSDGISNLNPKVDTLIISGLGGETIIKILKDSCEKLKNITKIIVSPHTKLPSVREYLYTNGFKLILEHVVIQTGKIYVIMAWERSEVNFTVNDIVYGKLRRMDSVLAQQYLEQHKRNLDKQRKLMEEKYGN